MKRAWIIPLALAAVCVLWSPALASEHGAQFKLLDFIGAVFNFAIFLFILIWFGKKGIQSYYKDRAETQLAAVKEAEQALEDVKEIHEQLEERRLHLKEETEDLIENAKRRAGLQAEEILAAARRQAERIVDDAKRTVESEIDQAKKRLRAELVDIALQVAEDQIQGRLDDSKQRQIIEQFVSGMERPQ